MKKPLFSLGRVAYTPGAQEAMADAGETWNSLLKRHISGDWLEMSPDDAQANKEAVYNEERILSAYTLSTGVRIWVITEWDRSATTFLLPDEY